MHAQGGIAHEADVHPPRVRVGRLVEAAGVVLRDHLLVPDGLTEPHMVEEPIGVSAPEVGEGGARCQCGTQEVVLAIEVAEIAAEQDGEDALQVARCELGRAAHASGIVPPTAPATVAPQVASRGHAGEIVDRGNVGGIHQRSEAPPSRLGERIAVPAEIVVDQGPGLRGDQLVLPAVQFEQVVAQERVLVLAEGGQVGHVHTPHGQFHGARDRGLIEFPIAHHVVVPGIELAGAVHRVVGPAAVHLAVVRVGRPGPVVVAVPIGREVAAVRHRHVADQQHGLHIGGVRGVVRGDERLHTGHRGRAGHVVPQHLPSIALEIRCELQQLRRQRRGKGVVHDQHHLAPCFHHRQLDACVHIPVAIAQIACTADDLVLVARVQRHAVVHVLQAARAQRGDRRTPTGGRFQFPIDRETGRVGVAGPIDRDPRRCRLHRGPRLHGTVMRDRLRIRLARGHDQCRTECSEFPPDRHHERAPKVPSSRVRARGERAVSGKDRNPTSARCSGRSAEGRPPLPHQASAYPLFITTNAPSSRMNSRIFTFIPRAFA